MRLAEYLGKFVGKYVTVHYSDIKYKEYIEGRIKEVGEDYIVIRAEDFEDNFQGEYIIPLSKVNYIHVEPSLKEF